MHTFVVAVPLYDSISGKASDILAKVTLNTNPGGIIFHDPQDTKHESLLRSSVINGDKRITLNANRANGVAVGNFLRVVVTTTATGEKATHFREITGLNGAASNPFPFA